MNNNWLWLSDLVMSGLGLFSMFVVGKKSKLGWVLGLVNQVFWINHIVQTRSVGMIPFEIGIILIYVKNLVEWNKKK